MTTDLLRRYGRSLRGTRLRDHTPCSHWQTHTVVAALRPTELTATAVAEHCRGCLPVQKTPKQVFIVSSLPKSDRGKVLRDKLKDDWKARSMLST